MKIAFYEIKKVISSKLFCLVLVIILLCNAFCGIYSGYRNTGGIKDIYFIELTNLYKENPGFVESEVNRVKNNLLSQIEKIDAEISSGNTAPPLFHEFNYIDDGVHTDFDLLQSFIDKRNTILKYKDTISSYIKQAELNKQRNILISNNQDVLSTLYQDIIIDRYSWLSDNLHLSFDYVYGWDRLFSYTGNAIFSFTSSVLITIWIVLLDVSNNSVAMIRTAKNGRKKTVFSKLSAALILSIVFTGFIFIETFLIHYITCGFSNFKNPVQLLSDYVLCPWILNFFQVYLLNLLSVIMCIIPIVLVVSLISTLTYTYTFPILSFGILCGVSLLLYTTASSSLFGKFNIFFLSSIYNMFSKYNSIGIGKHILELFWFSGTLLFVISLFLGVVLFLCSKKTIFLPSRKNLFSAWKSHHVLHPTSHAISNNYTSILLLWEFYKKSQVFLLTIFFISIQIIALYFSPTITPATDSLFYEYAQTLQGEINQDKLNFISDEIQFISSTIEKFDQKFLDYQSKAISHDEYDDYLKEYQYSLARQNVIQDIKQYAEYLFECNQNGIDAIFIYDTGLSKLVSPQFNWVLFTCIVLFVVPSFTIEYKESSSSSSMSKLIRTTKNGRSQTFWNKLFCNCLFALLSFVIYTVFYIFHILSSYTLDSLSAPMASMQAYYDFGNLPISIFLILTYFFSLIFIIGLSILATSLSQIIKNQLVVYLTVFGITILPHAFSFFGVQDARYFDFVYLSCGNNILSVASSISPETPVLISFLLTLSFSLLIFGLLIFSKFSYTRRN